MVPESLIEAARNLLLEAGDTGQRLEITPLASGGNNRVFLVESESGRRVAKWYYHDASGMRDRARAEFEFLSHIRRFGIRNVPQPIAHDPQHHLALYEFIAGRPVSAAELSTDLINQAAHLFATINSGPVRAAGGHLQPASDACFTIGEHIRSVDSRLKVLSAIQTRSATDREAVALVGRISAVWERIKGELQKHYPDVDAPLPSSWRSLSPSDLGFHNALLRENGQLCFLDFEYAGWDDPAKMVGDFFSHPGLSVPLSYFEPFASGALEPFDGREELITRARRLSTVSRIRWCCIMLNEFLPDIATRRKFADPAVDMGERKKRQLEKARALFALTHS